MFRYQPGGGYDPTSNAVERSLQGRSYPTLPQLKSKYQFGLNYEHIATSEALRGILGYFANKRNQKDALQYQKLQSNPMLQLPFNPNTSNESLYGEDLFKKGGHWLQHAVHPSHKGYCTPMTKSTCTGRRRAFALTMKKHHGFHKKDDGGFINDTGYLDGYESADNPFNIIPGGEITMQGVSSPLMAHPIKKGKVGKGSVLKPGGEYKFDADAVLEYQMKKGGLSRSKDYGSKKKPYPSVKSGDFAGGHRSYPIPTHADAVDALRLAGLHHRADVKAKVYAKYPDLKKQKGGEFKKTLDSINIASKNHFLLEKTNFLNPELTPEYNQQVEQDIKKRYQEILDLAKLTGIKVAPVSQFIGEGFKYPTRQDNNLMPQKKQRGGPTASKAKEMLHDGTAHGKPLTAKQKRYFGWLSNKQRGGGIEDYYQQSAVFSYYKNMLNNRLKEKDPAAFDNYFKGLHDLRTSGKTKDAETYVQNTPYNTYLSNDEVKQALGDEGYKRYLASLQAVNTYNVQQGKQPLYGTVEGEKDVTSLNYGRRFASLQMTPSFGVGNKNTGASYNRMYTYSPDTGVGFTESGDVSLRPDYLTSKQEGGSFEDGFEDYLLEEDKPKQEEPQTETAEQQAPAQDYDEALAYVMGEQRDPNRFNGSYNWEDESPNEENPEDFKSHIAKSEGAGYFTQNKKSSSFGKYQFIKATRENAREKFFPEINKKDFEALYKTSPAFQEKVMDKYSGYLLDKYKDPKKAAIAFFLGEGRANMVDNPNFRPDQNNPTVGQYLKRAGYQRGGEYDISESELAELKNAGYDFEII